MNCARAYWIALAVVLTSVIAPRTAAAQQGESGLQQAAEARLGRPLSPAEILQRLRQSGITRSEARARLQQMGYDPSLVDPYYDALEGGTTPPAGAASDQFLSALQRLGVTQAAPLTTPDVTPTATTDKPIPQLGPEAGGPPVDPRHSFFGNSLFDQSNNQFAPLASGPVDPSYRLGPGDRLSLILTGDVEQAYQLDVTREGYIVVPDVGQVLVNGLTLGQLDDLLYARLGRVYSGVRRDASATTRFHVAMDQVRAIQVYLVGDVERPGAYQVSGLSTVFDALYRAGGPAERGSYRRIEVRRGGAVAHNVDIYNYLLHGDSRDDIRLEQGDIVFVPVADRVVRLDGQVRRPAYYELKPGESLEDVVRFAGGLLPDAVVRRVQVDRVLPPDRRRPGLDRVLMDVDISQLTTGGAPFALQDGDVIHVFAISDERRHRVVVTGGVNRPGIYEWTPGVTLGQLIDRAQGLDEQAYTSRAHIFRLNPEDGTRRLMQVPLVLDSTSHAVSSAALVDRDSIVVYNVARLANAAYVNIDGFVKQPGAYALADGMTLQDLILAAGGFMPGAEVGSAEVARGARIDNRSDTTATVVRVLLQPSMQKGSPGDGSGSGQAGRDVPAWTPTASEFTLRDRDRVFVRKAPGFAPPRQVTIGGEVLTPGTYVLRDRQETLADIIERTGGLTRQGYPDGMQLFRRGRLLPTDLTRALRDTRSRYNVVLEEGDSIVIPAYDPTVNVTGRIAFESRVLFRPGEGLNYYIQQAGGYSQGADVSRASVTYANGERSALKRFIIFHHAPAIRPGATIVVPAVPANKQGVNWDNFLSRTLAVMSTLATVLIAYDRLK